MSGTDVISAAGGGQDLDAERLERYLERRVPGLRGPLQIDRLSGGQSNPTYRITCSDGRRYALRKKPAGKLLASAHAIEREYQVTRALHGTGFPVPEPHLLCEDTDVVGTAFYLMDFVEGRVLREPSLPGVDPEERSAIWNELGRVIALLHCTDYRAIGLGDFGKPDQFLARQIRRWTTQYRASELDRIDAMDRLIAWLPANIPPGDEPAIVHGDYRLENVIFHPRKPRILAVLDWELSTLGHPLADFAYLALSWHIPPRLLHGIPGIETGTPGIPSQSEFVEKYCERAGRPALDPATWSYYIVYNLFRSAAIMQGIAKRALEGNAAGADAARVGQNARPLAELAWALATQPQEEK